MNGIILKIMKIINDLLPTINSVPINNKRVKGTITDIRGCEVDMANTPIKCEEHWKQK